jgi:ParB family chromosome partitioning protein
MDQFQLDNIPLDKIELGYNVRKEDLEKGIDELALNIETIGLQQPVVVFKKADRYELIIGQRRYLAFKKLGRDSIPAIITKVTSETDAIIKSFSENVHRLDLGYRDKNRVAKELKEKYKNDDKVAKYLGVSVQTVRNYLGYSGVTEEVKALVDGKKISANTAIRIARSVSDPKKALAIAQSVIEEPRSDDRIKIIDTAKENPEKTIEEIVKIAKKPSRRIVIHVTERIANALDDANKKYTSSDEDIATDALEEWLKFRGFIND